MTTHLSWETINDAADDLLAAGDQARVSAHLAQCPACNEQFVQLRALLGAAAGATEPVVPPTSAWPNIRHAIDAKKSVSLPGDHRLDRRFRVSRRSLAAAAVVLMAVSSGITAVVLRRPLTTSPGSDTSAVELTTASMAREIAVMEREYLSTATELRAALDKERAELSPATIATVERSLRVIDDAIAEAREALVLDPANGALRDLLRRSHEQKIDFLRRTTALLGKA